MAAIIPLGELDSAVAHEPMSATPTTCQQHRVAATAFERERSEIVAYQCPASGQRMHV